MPRLRKVKIPPTRVLHFLLRYGDQRGVNTIVEHTNVLAKRGSVWFGKFGVGSNVERINQARQQIQQGVPTYVYLATKARIGHRGTIVEIAGGGLRAQLRVQPTKLIPAYYRGQSCSVWMRLSALIPVPKGDVEMLAVYSSPFQRPDMNCSRGMVYVTHNRDATRIHYSKGGDEDDGSVGALLDDFDILD